jgi:hypothetical protein
MVLSHGRPYCLDVAPPLIHSSSLSKKNLHCAYLLVSVWAHGRSSTCRSPLPRAPFPTAHAGPFPLPAPHPIAGRAAPPLPSATRRRLPPVRTSSPMAGRRHRDRKRRGLCTLGRLLSTFPMDLSLPATTVPHQVGHGRRRRYDVSGVSDLCFKCFV